MNTAIITGAAHGIGLALSIICLRKGIKVVMTDKNEVKLNAEAHSLHHQFPGQVLWKACDVTLITDVMELVLFTKENLERIDWIYNNAGIIGPLAPVWELQPEQIQAVMNINVFGMINIIQAFIPLLFEQQFNSHIINMASLYALCSGSQIGLYSMSKHAVLSLSESLYFDLRHLEKPVDVSVVFPSFTDTSLLANKSAAGNSSFHDSLSALLAHSRSALDVAMQIVNEVEQKRFYILPDKEVKGYCEERTAALVLQDKPHLNNIERLMSSLLRRKNRQPAMI